MPPHRVYQDLVEADFPSTGKIMQIDGTDAMLAWGTSVPTDAVTGYAHGCIFLDTDATTAATALYVNDGTAASANFNAMPTDLASTANGKGASLVGVEDAGGFTSNANVESVLAEILQDLVSTKAQINVPMGAIHEADGTALADFSDGASPTPGISAGDESYGIRWNNHANPDPVSFSVPKPQDLDASGDVVMHIAAAKVGATLGDAVTWTVEAFENVDAALYDADADFGGASSAMTGDAATKTVQVETLTLAAANISATEGIWTFTIQPTDGTLGTDDVILLGIWLEYTRALRTS